MNPDIPPLPNTPDADRRRHTSLFTNKWLLLAIAAVVLLIVIIVVAATRHHSKSAASGNTKIIYDKSGKPGAASSIGQPIKVGDYAYVNACNALPFSTVSKKLGGPGEGTVANSTYAEATTDPAYISDDGIEADCAYDIATDSTHHSYRLQLIETLSPDMAEAAQKPDKATLAAMQPVTGLNNARYGFTHDNGDGIYGLVDNIYYKFSVADLKNATNGGRINDAATKEAMIDMAKQLVSAIHTHKAGDSRAASTATTATTNGIHIVNNPCDILTNDIFANGIKTDIYIPAGNRIPSPSNINSVTQAQVSSTTGTDRYMTTCTRKTADTTNYGAERAGSANLQDALRNFTQPENTAGATVTVNVATYASAQDASEEMAGIVYMQAEGAQPVNGYGDAAVYIPVASLSSDDHVSQLSVQKGPYIIDIVYFADQSLDITHNKTAQPADYKPFIAPLLSKLPH